MASECRGSGRLSSVKCNFMVDSNLLCFSLCIHHRKFLLSLFFSFACFFRYKFFYRSAGNSGSKDCIWNELGKLSFVDTVVAE